MDRIDCVIIGAGIVGLAVARKLVLSGAEVAVLEAAEKWGMEASSRTGEVVHAGIHYPPGSLRARLCAEGRELLYGYCLERGVEHRRIGELVVATETVHLEGLRAIMDQALVNGVPDVQILDRKEVSGLEPGLTCEGALLSPSTGIVDSHGLMKALHADASDAGAILVLNTPVTGGRLSGRRFELEYGGPEPGVLSCQTVVNCAGIHAQGVAASLKGFDPAWIPPHFLCKGSYFTAGKAPPISRLVFSMPSVNAPGIHLSFDLAGQARFGPDSQWMENILYDVDPSRSGIFEDGVRRYWPELPEGSLKPGFAGYFARACGPGDPVTDWMIQSHEDHGVPGLVNLFGIDSPGMTACMAIAEMVEGMV